MKIVEPKSFIVGETVSRNDEMDAALEEIGAKGWQTDASIFGEKLIEFGGRLCYLSFEPGLNRNVTRVRKGWRPYIKNILESGHGSVLEHACVNVVFTNVTKVFTHELIRHRAGSSYSQVSGRFVLWNDLGMWIPPSIRDDPDLVEELVSAFMDAEEHMQNFEDLSGLESAESFSEKKKLTSTRRRISPEGAATHILCGFNHRAWRHVFTMRCDPSAEEEIAFVLGPLLKRFQGAWPALYEDIKLLGNEINVDYKKV